MPLTETGLTVAVDIGGTFTDVALLDRKSGKTWRGKTPSIPSDPSQAFMNGISLVLEQAGYAATDLRQVLHGTTVATNMILEGKGARTALVTTAGFRHVLAIGRQDIPRKENLYTWVKPERPVPASRVLEVKERLGAGGGVLIPLDEESVRSVGRELQEMAIEAVAVCLLHAFANPDHERRVASILSEMLPGIAVSASTDVLPVVREFERSLTAVLNATVMPGVTTYVSRLEERLNASGVSAPLLLMQSNGGIAGTPTIRKAPALTGLSGPAAGIVGAKAIAERCGIRDLITVDIGGTSADICLIKDGRVDLTSHGRIGNWPLSLPMVDMVTIGAGGGSIARVEDGTLTVGPQSAGASPGPASYGRGGTEATVTDAHVVLGHMPARLLGGAMKLDLDAARQAVRRSVADELDLDVDVAARGILAIADNHMVGAVRVVSVERGHDPRDFTLVPFGGAGPLHGCALAELLGISKILLPPAPGVLCADGLLHADLRAEFSQTLPKAGVVETVEAESILGTLERQATDWLDREGVRPEDRSIRVVALLRYQGQGSEIPVPWDDDSEQVKTSFVDAHSALYGFTLKLPIEVMTLRVEAEGRTERTPELELPTGDPAIHYDEVNVSFAAGARNVPVIDRASLGTGSTFSGPAIVTQHDTTTLVNPGWHGTVHPSGAIILTHQQEPSK